MDISVIKYYVENRIALHLLILHRVHLEIILDPPYFLPLSPSCLPNLITGREMSISFMVT